MPLLRYEESHCSREHEIGVTSAAFSSNNTYLATAGLDGRVCVWDVRSHALLHTYKNTTPIVSLDWMYPGESNIVIGYQDGNVATLSFPGVVFSVNGFVAHKGSVDCIASCDRFVATAARQEVCVWEWRALAPWKLVIALPGPAKVLENVSLEVLVVDVHWTSWADHPSVLMVSYQNHGVLLYESSSWQLIHTVQIRSPISSVSLAPDGEHIALYNLAKGVEIRSLSEGTVRGAFPPDSGEKLLLPVTIVHDGGGVVVGSTDGNVGVWDLRYSIKIQDLHHQKQERVLAMAATYDKQTDRYLIVTGTYAGHKTPVAVRWWVADEARVGDHQTQSSTTLAVSNGWNKGWLAGAFVVGAAAATAIGAVV